MSVPVYVVSLRRSNERRRSIREQMERVGVPFEFFDAYDASTVSEEDLNTIATSEAVATMTKGAIGCAHSHLRLYHIIAKKHPQGAVILEDDIILRKGFGAVCQALSRPRSGRGTHIIHFGGLDAYNAFKIQLSPQHKMKVGRGIHLYRVEELDRNFHGTFAYYISREAAYHLATKWPKVEQPADLWHETAKDGLVNEFWMAFPSVCHHPRDASISEVETGLRKNAHASRVFRAKELVKRWWYPVRYRTLMTYRLKLRPRA